MTLATRIATNYPVTPETVDKLLAHPRVNGDEQIARRLLDLGITRGYLESVEQILVDSWKLQYPTNTPKDV